MFYPILSIKRCREASDTANEKQVLNSFRTDIERSMISLPKGNFDVSLFCIWELDEALSYVASNRVLEQTDISYSKVRTNRLHVAIAGARIGKTRGIVRKQLLQM